MSDTASYNAPNVACSKFTITISCCCCLFLHYFNSGLGTLVHPEHYCPLDSVLDVLKILRGYRGTRPDTREGDFAKTFHALCTQRSSRSHATFTLHAADHGYRLFRKPRSHSACTAEPRLTATSVIRSPRYGGHFFWPGKTAIHFLIKKTLVNAVTR